MTEQPRFNEAEAKVAADQLARQVAGGFIALDEARRQHVAAIINKHFANLGHSKSVRWRLTSGEPA